MDTTAIQSAVTAVGGQTALAKKIGRSQSLVWQWCVGRLPVTAELCGRVEVATSGAITREMLRPDVFGAMPVNDLREAG